MTLIHFDTLKKKVEYSIGDSDIRILYVQSNIRLHP